MKLTALLREAGLDAHPTTEDPEVTGVACDSRKVRPGHLFVAVRGARDEGHRYVEAAFAVGAAACVADVPCPGASGPVLQVPDAEAALGALSAAFWGHPSRRLDLVGVTGTNGKTTTAYLVQHLLCRGGVATGRLGTVSYAYPSGEEPAPLTTPDAPTLQAALRRMADEGAGAAVMEVSSHALERRRVEGCTFRATVFTNLTQDHLDYHGSMDRYFEAKRRLFTSYAPEAPAAIGIEDPYGRRLAEELGSRAATFGLAEGEFRFRISETAATGTRGRFEHPGGAVEVAVPLPGEFNARNAAAALTVACLLGQDPEAAAAALEHAPQVPGRMELIADPSGLSVIVDYAHTPDALDRILEAARRATRGRLLCVFGCGGDRDRTKRPLMAAAAARWSDAVVLTADNSRSEDTAAILEEICRGMPRNWTETDGSAGTAQRSWFARVPDRVEAIRRAVALAGPGDTVIVAGKGHETTQTIGARVSAFDDRAEARAALALKRAG